MAYWFIVPGAVIPHGYCRCSLPPAAAYSHSASLGRKPPSQMQNAYASYQFTQLIGRFSRPPVADASEPGGPASKHPPPVTWNCAGGASAKSLFPGPPPPPPAVAVSPPPLRYACLPDPAAGIQPPFHAAANCRYRPTVTR